MIDDLDPDALSTKLADNWGRSVTVLETTDSTMDEASKAAATGAPDGHVVVADRQTRGRGAHGRSWVSPAGTDLYFSIVARPAIAPRSMALITLATGLGVRDAVASLVPRRSVAVKWPNDVWVDQRKCAGILVESRLTGTTIDAVIIGVGLNVNRTEWPPELEGIATSLRAESSAASPLSRPDVLVEVLTSIDRSVRGLVDEGPERLVDTLRKHLALVGQPVRWEDGSGVFEGIDAQGAALVRSEGRILTLHAAHFERV